MSQQRPEQRPERSRRIIPPPTPPRPSRRLVEYLVGLAIGAIPMILLLLAIGGLASQISSALLVWAVILYIFSFISAIGCLVNPSSRFVGYGLLTMVFVTPIVFYIACVASFRYGCYRC